MIQLIQFTEMVHDIRGKVNAMLPPEEQISGVIVSPKEEHMVKKLKDKAGILLCSSFPDCDTEIESNDQWNSKNHCLMFLLEKVSAGDRTDAEELERYVLFQNMMGRLKKVLMAGNFSCEYNFEIPKQIRTEWEYNIYGGYNGLSIGFDLTDND